MLPRRWRGWQHRYRCRSLQLCLGPQWSPKVGERFSKERKKRTKIMTAARRAANSRFFFVCVTSWSCTPRGLLKWGTGLSAWLCAAIPMSMEHAVDWVARFWFFDERDCLDLVLGAPVPTLQCASLSPGCSYEGYEPNHGRWPNIRGN